MRTRTYTQLDRLAVMRHRVDCRHCVVMKDHAQRLASSTEQATPSTSQPGRSTLSEHQDPARPPMFTQQPAWEIPGTDEEGPHKVLFSAWDLRDRVAPMLAGPEGFRSGAPAVIDGLREVARGISRYGEHFVYESEVRRAVAAIDEVAKALGRIHQTLDIYHPSFLAELAQKVPPIIAVATKAVDHLFTKTTVLHQTRGVLTGEVFAALAAFGPGHVVPAERAG